MLISRKRFCHVWGWVIGVRCSEVDKPTAHPRFSPSWNLFCLVLGFISAPATELTGYWQGEDLSCSLVWKKKPLCVLHPRTNCACVLASCAPRSERGLVHLCSAADSVAPVFLLCAVTESVIKAADVSLGPVFIHVYADSGMLGGRWVEGIDAEVELYGCSAGVTFRRFYIFVLMNLQDAPRTPSLARGSKINSLLSVGNFWSNSVIVCVCVSGETCRVDGIVIRSGWVNKIFKSWPNLCIENSRSWF